MRLPVIHMLKEAAPRQGFFERDQFDAVRRKLEARPDLQVAVTIAYVYGWRMRSEVLPLMRRQVDLEAGTLRLSPGTTNKKPGRVVYLTPELDRLVREQLARVRDLERRTERIIPVLFPHLAGRHVGQPIQEFRRAWKTACRRAGCPGMLRHDFRRTAVRNLVNTGTPEKVAMLITGHRSRSVFDRYHIVAPEDLQAATARLAARDGDVSCDVRLPAGDGRAGSA
jgi:integrase